MNMRIVKITTDFEKQHGKSYKAIVNKEDKNMVKKKKKKKTSNKD